MTANKMMSAPSSGSCRHTRSQTDQQPKLQMPPISATFLSALRASVTPSCHNTTMLGALSGETASFRKAQKRSQRKGRRHIRQMYLVLCQVPNGVRAGDDRDEDELRSWSTICLLNFSANKKMPRCSVAGPQGDYKAASSSRCNPLVARRRRGLSEVCA